MGNGGSIKRDSGNKGHFSWVEDECQITEQLGYMYKYCYNASEFNFLGDTRHHMRGLTEKVIIQQLQQFSFLVLVSSVGEALGPITKP